MNDLFLFIEKCHIYNYADDDALDSSSENLADVLYNLRHDGRNDIEWFAKINGMQANSIQSSLQNSRSCNYVMARLLCMKLR